MADFEIKANQIMNVSSQLSDIQKSVSKISAEASSILRQTRGSITARISAALQRTVVCNNINKCATDMANLSNGLSDAVQYYLAYEKNVLNKTFGKAVKIKSKNSKKSKWEQFKEDVKKKVKGISKAVVKKAKEVKSKIKNAAKKLWEGTKKAASKTWDFIKDTAGNIKDNFVNAYNYIKKNYNEKGWIYEAVQYGKAIVSIAANTAAIVGAVASILGTGGLSTPAAIATIIYGFNGLANSFTDVYNLHQNNFDALGQTNYLKSFLAGTGEWVGEKLGNEKIGKAIGTGIYYAGSLYTTFANLSNSIDKAKQIDNVKVGDAFKSAKQMSKDNVFGKIMTTDFRQVKLQTALLKTSKEYKAFFDFGKNLEVYSQAFGKAISFAFDISEAGIDVTNTATGLDLSSNIADTYDKVTGNPVQETYDGVKGTYDNIKDTYKLISNLVKASRLKTAN